VLSIGMNQTIDRTIRLDALLPGHVLRARDVAVTAGGKAINVCRAAMSAGARPALLGVFPGSLGQYAITLLEAEGLEVTAVAFDGDLRSTSVYLEDSGRATVVNEPGPALPAAAWQRLLAEADRLVAGHRVVGISGSLPPGAPADSHALLIGVAHRHGARLAVDCAGDALIGAARAGADLVSPNLSEAEGALGTARDEEVEPTGDDVAERACRAASALVELGAVAALVSAGRHGVAVADGPSVAFVPAPEVEERNPIGAGDALLGGTLVGLDAGRSVIDAARFGVAVAAASVAHPVAGYADPGLIDALHRRVSA
jgi:1-phosphofructokinase family hexose kinase